MTRLTKYLPNINSMIPYRLKDEELSTKLDSIHKLGELEDIEEELGIELTVLFSALKNGVYYLTSDGQLTHDYVRLEDDHVCTGQQSKLSFSFRTFSEVDTLLFSDYGKTWAVNKKVFAKGELKNDR